MENNVKISVKGLKKSFGSLEVLKCIDEEIGLLNAPEEIDLINHLASYTNRFVVMIG